MSDGPKQNRENRVDALAGSAVFLQPASEIVPELAIDIDCAGHRRHGFLQAAPLDVNEIVRLTSPGVMSVTV